MEALVWNAGVILAGGLNPEEFECNERGVLTGFDTDWCVDFSLGTGNAIELSKSEVAAFMDSELKPRLA